eukprot:4466721-Prymnesium_polylepis.1
MQHERTSPVRPRATGVKSPGLSGPHIDLGEAARESTRSNKVGTAEGSAATDGACAHHQRIIGAQRTAWQRLERRHR